MQAKRAISSLLIILFIGTVQTGNGQHPRRVLMGCPSSCSTCSITGYCTNCILDYCLRAGKCSYCSSSSGSHGKVTLKPPKDFRPEISGYTKAIVVVAFMFGSSVVFIVLWYWLEAKDSKRLILEHENIRQEIMEFKKLSKGKPKTLV